MKNKKTLTAYKNNSNLPRKQYHKVFRIYPVFLYHRLDRWLKLMSEKGWHIAHCSLFFFFFEKGQPSTKEYFTYGLSTQEGKYSISLRHPFLEKKYGLEKNKSIINANKAKSYQIVEIDTEKIDVINDVGYRELVKDRNRLYLIYSIRNLCIVLFCAILCALLFIFLI